MARRNGGIVLVTARVRRLLTFAVLLVVAATLTQPITGLRVLPEHRALAFACPAPVNIVNGSFESPVMTNTTWQLFNDTQVPGWTTTAADGMFEFWRSGFQGVPAVAGNQLVELNANVPGTVSQVIDTSTLQGHTIQYSFWHRGRNGTDTMRVSIGPASGVANFTRNVSTGNTAWVQYSGDYLVPVGQTSTRFSYGAVSAAGGTSQGNLLDDIRFGTPPCATDLSVTKTASPARYVPGQPVTFTIVVANTGASAQQYDLVGARLVDTVPAAITGVTWTCSASAGSACSAATGSGNAINTTYNILEGGRVTYTVTGTAPASGLPDPLTNTATVSTPAGVTDTNPANNTATALVPKAVARLAVDKSSTTPGPTLSIGDVITYRFSVTNNGEVPLTNVTVTDPLVGLSAINCDGDNVIATLAVGANVVCTATYVVTLVDFILGSVVNTATATGTPPPGITPPVATDALVTPTPPNPSVTVDKTSDASGPAGVGDEVTYSYAVTNTGNVPLTVTVTDGHAGLSAIDCGGNGDHIIEAMVPGGPVTCIATYTVTQADVDSGSIANTVNVSATPPTGAPVGASDSLTIDTVAADPGLAIGKTASFAAPVVVGALVTYSITVTNTGNVTLSAVTVRDPLPGLSPVDCGGGSNVIATIDPAGPPVVCTATYRVTQADVDRGGITNTANATATTPPGTPPVPQVFEGAGVPIAQSPAVSITKSSDAAGELEPGQTVTYTFSVSNIGNVTLENLTVDDPLPGLSDIDCDGDNVITSIAPGASPVECTATYVVTPADADNGSFSNMVTVTGTPVGSTVAVSDSDTVSSPVDQEPALTLAKVATAPAVVGVGDDITYTFTLVNSGNVTLTDVTVTDPLPNLSAIDCGGDGDAVIESFAPGGPITCTATYTVTQADVDAGNIHNSATATGTPPPGAPELDPPVADEDVPIARTASIDIVKSSDLTTPNEVTPGTVITYEFSVTNTGNVGLTDVTVTDPLEGMSDIDCDGSGDNVVAALAPGASAECSATYAVTAADIDAGIVQNTATATGTPPAGLTPPTDSSTLNSPFDPLPAITIDKTADYDAPLAAGDAVTYTFVVTNTGNVSLTAVAVTDDTLPGLSAIDCDGSATIARIAAGASRTCTATYPVTQADVDAGTIANTASVVGTPPFGGDPVTDEDGETIGIPASPAITIDKTADPTGPVDVGDDIAYTIVVTNTGNVTLTDVTVTDTLPGLSAIDCGDGTAVVASLAPAGAATCTGTYTVSQSAADVGEVANSASATGTPPGGEPIPPATDTVTVDVEQNPAMTLTKSASPASGVGTGGLVTYTFTVANTGNVTIYDVAVADPLPGLSAVTCGGSPTITSIAPAATATCTATYTVTQADVDAGAIVNSATATALPPPGGPDVPPAEGGTEIPIDQVAALSVTKSAVADPGFEVDGVVTYTFSVSNTGNVSLTDVTVVDPLDGLSATTCGAGGATIPLLLPGSPVECTATYTITQDDIDNEVLANTVTVNGTPPAGVDPPAPATGTHESPFTSEPGVAIDKTANTAGPVGVGDTITYRFAVTNSGNVTLTDITVTDPLPGLSPIDCGGDTAGVIGSMAPGGPRVCTATYTVTQADVDNGSIANTASVTGTPPGDEDPLDPVDDSLEIPTNAAAPALSIDKTVDDTGPVSVGDELTYSFTVANTGNVTLTDVTVTDPLAGLSAIDCAGSPTIASLAPADDPVVCTATYTVSQTDVDNGSIANTASVTGTPPGGDPTEPVSDSLEVPTDDPAPGLTIDKTAAHDAPLAVGDVVTYSFAVANTGNVTLTDVTVTDPLAGLSAIDCAGSPTIASLAPADDPVVCTATYTVSQTDVDNGSIANTASVTGTPPGGEPTEPVTDTAEVPIPRTPVLTLTKSPDPATAGGVGDSVTYTFTVENTGNVTLTDVTVTDPLNGLSAIDCDGSPTIVTLAPDDAPVTCTATYTITQPDVDAGTVHNEATATATPPPGAPAVTPAVATADVVVPQTPGLSLSKDSDATAPVAVGDLITYTFTVENTGNVTLTGVTVTDPLDGLSTVDCGGGSPTIATLAPDAAPATCTATYTITQTDVDAGSVVNAASVTGTTPGGDPLPPVPAESTVLIERSPAMTLTKSADPAAAAADGDVITYTFTVDNTGNVTLTALTVTDPLAGLSAIDCGGGSATIATLAPADDPVVCTATYTVSQADVDGAGVTNTATLDATPPPGSDPIDPVESHVEVPIAPTPGLSIVKTADVAVPAADGDTITYSFTVGNTGNVTLTEVTVTDPLAGLSAIDCGGGSATIATLPPAATATCTATYTVTLGDLDAGAVVNTASVTGTSPDGGSVPPATDTVTTPLDGVPGVSIEKTSGGVNDVDGNGASAGDTVTFFFVVTNTGSITLDGISVDDPLLGGPIPCGSGPLVPGTSRTCDAAVYTLTGDDVSADGPTELENTATVSATTPGGSAVSASDFVITSVPPECSAATTTTSTSSTSSTTSTSTSSTTSIAPVAPSEPESTEPTGTVEPPESSEPVETEAPATEPTTEAPVTSAEPVVTEAPADTPPEVTPAPLRGAAGEYRAPAVRPAQVDPCAVPPTTTTTTTVAGPVTTLPGPGPTSGGPVAGGGGTLPATGGNPAGPTLLAIVLVAAGVATVVMIKRRRTV